MSIKAIMMAYSYYLKLQNVPVAIVSKLQRSIGTLILLLAFIPNSFAAAFVNYTIEDGLSQSIVFSITQDKAGFMWFSTQDGLNRFDGNRFLIFKSSAKNIHSLADNYIYPLISDESNNLWLGTRSAGVDQLSLESYLFRHLSAANTPLMQNRITSLHYHQQKIWIGTYHGDLHYFDLMTQSLSEPILNLDKPIYTIMADSKQQLWLGTHGNGLTTYQLSNQTQHHYLATENKNGLQHNSIFSIIEDKQQRVWLGTQGGGLHQFISHKEGFKHWQHDSSNNQSISHNEVRSVFQDKQMRIWIGTRGGGLNLYQEQTDSFVHFKHDATDKYSLAHDRVYTIFQDTNDILWIGTANGVSKFDPSSLAFAHIKAPEALRNNDIWSLFQDSNENLWIGSWGGGLDKITEKLDSPSTAIANILTSSTNNDAIKSIVEDQQKQLWIGTWGEGLKQFNLVTGKSKDYINNKQNIYSLSDNNIFSLLIDNNNSLWVGTDGGGLNRFEPSSQRFLHSKNSTETLLNIPSKKIFSLYQDTFGMYWIGTDGQGLFRYDSLDGSLRQFSTNSSPSQSTSHNTIRSIHEDAQGNIWFGTSNGLNKFSKSTQNIEHFGVEDGLPNQVIYAIESGPHDQIWISTNKGLSRYDTIKNKFTNFRHIDGIQGDEFNADASVKLADGRLAFGGNNGVTLFSPQSIQNKPSIGNISLTDVQFNNGSVFDQANENLAWFKSLNSGQQTIEIDYSIARLSLNFVYLKFVKPELTKFNYRLRGFDQDWQQHQGSLLNLEYTNLDPGQYELEVVASQGYDHSTSTPMRLLINVTPAPWNTWWAYVIYFSVFIISLVVYLRLHTLKVEQQKKVLETLVEQRTTEIAKQQKVISDQSKKLQETLNAKNRFFTNVSHEIRTPLSLMIAPLQRLVSEEKNQQKQADLSLVLRNGERLKGLVNNLLSLSHGESLKKKPIQTINLSALGHNTACQFHTSYQHNQINFEFDIDDNIYVNASKEGLESILINLLANSYKYTNQGFIHLSIKTKPEHNVLITVTDSGIGIPHQQQKAIFEPFNRGKNNINDIEGTGIGLAIVQDLCQKFRATMSVKSELGKGSCFTVTFAEVAKDISETTKPKLIDNHIKQATQAQPQTLTTKKTVLIVEDNNELRQFLYREFKTKYNVLTANDGREGFKVAQQELPDLIISDIMMPEMDGIEMLEQINLDQLTCHIPVILLTAKSDQETKLHGLKSHALDFIAKPFDQQELQIKVHNWLVWTEQIAKKQGTVAHVGQRTLCSQDELFIKKLNELLSQNYSDTDLEIEFIAKEMAVSLRQLQRKVKSLTAQSPIEYLRNYRINKGQQMLAEGLQISVVAERVGFKTSSYFAKVFKAKHKVSPKEYQQAITAN